MTAGRGIIHSEMPEQENGRLAGFQLWVNLPSEKKLCEPAYHEYPKEEIPVESRLSGTEVRVIAGVTSEGTKGPVSDVVTSPLYLDIDLPANTLFEEVTPQGHSCFVFVINGALEVLDRDSRETVSARQLAVLGAGSRVRINAGASGARLLFVCAQALHEPVARYGPLVMNTREEIEKAVEDFNSGQF